MFEGIDLNRVVRSELIEKMTADITFEEWEGDTHVEIGRTPLQGRENCKCKGPETAASLSYNVREVN